VVDQFLLLASRISWVGANYSSSPTNFFFLA
jgi:hypothetical protein